MSAILRTPDERFASLPDFPFAPHYLEGMRGCDGLRMHYVDAGNKDVSTTFFGLHGQPTWAYLFRRMLPVFIAAGHRIDAPGAALSREARNWLNTRWSGASFMAIGMKDPVLGPPAMSAPQRHIRGCPAPLEIPEAGHFVQEWGAPIATAALAHFALN